MNSRTRFNDIATFVASVAVGCGAAIAIASAAAVSQVAPTLRTSPAAPDVIRLDPVTVTVSKAYFDAVRSEESALARAADTKKVKHG